MFISLLAVLLQSITDFGDGLRDGVREGGVLRGEDLVLNIFYIDRVDAVQGRLRIVHECVHGLPLVGECWDCEIQTAPPPPAGR